MIPTSEEIRLITRMTMALIDELNKTGLHKAFLARAETFEDYIQLIATMIGAITVGTSAAVIGHIKLSSEVSSDELFTIVKTLLTAINQDFNNTFSKLESADFDCFIQNIKKPMH